MSVHFFPLKTGLQYTNNYFAGKQQVIAVTRWYSSAAYDPEYQRLRAEYIYAEEYAPDEPIRDASDGKRLILAKNLPLDSYIQLAYSGWVAEGEEADLHTFKRMIAQYWNEGEHGELPEYIKEELML